MGRKIIFPGKPDFERIFFKKGPPLRAWLNVIKQHIKNGQVEQALTKLLMWKGRFTVDYFTDRYDVDILTLRQTLLEMRDKGDIVIVDSEVI